MPLLDERQDEWQAAVKKRNRLLGMFLAILIFKVLVLAVYFESGNLLVTQMGFRAFWPDYRSHHMNKNNNKSNPKSKRRMLLIIGILSRSSAVARRQAIRDTWLTNCLKVDTIHCTFFSEYGKNSSLMQQELVEHNDLVLFDIPAGIYFARRLLAMYEWAVASYEFDYFLRVDDDYFICVDHLHYDVMHRPRKGLYWGYVHCQPNIVRIDEGWMITSVDIIIEVLSKRNTTLLCHPYGDQAFAMWMKDSQLNITYFYDNERVIHSAAFGASLAYMQADVCDRVLGLHGTPPQKMYQYWNRTEYLWNKTEYLGNQRTEQKSGRSYMFPEIPPFHSKCKLPNILDWRVFGGMYHHKPKLCRFKLNVTANSAEYRGRGLL